MQIISKIFIIGILNVSSIAFAMETQSALSKEALLQTAVRTGEVAELRSLLTEGANPNQPYEDGITPLHLAVINGQDEIVQILLSAGAQVNSTDPTTSASPLHLAALYGHLKIAGLLIQKGANVNAVMKFNITPLLVAAQFNKPEMVELLLKSKANINHPDQDGYTALHFAAEKGYENITRILLTHKAHKEARERSHNATPLMIAKENKQETIVTLLEEKKK